MKKLVVGMLLVGSLNVTGAFAEPVMDADRNFQHSPRVQLFERIPDLTDEQKVALQAIQEERKAERKARREAAKGMKGERLESLDSTDADYASQVEQIAEKAAERARAQVQDRASMHEKLQAILTPEQLQALHEMKKKAKKRANKAKGKKKGKRQNCDDSSQS